MARSDIHRPSVINPAEYEFVAVKYIGSSEKGEEISLGSAQIIGEHIRSTGGKYSSHEHGGTCHVCGAMAMYLAVWHHEPTNTYICTGEDCAQKMDLHGADFQRVRDQVRRDKAFTTGKARAQKELAERNLSAAWDIYSANVRDDYRYEEDTISDIVSKLVQYGSLSDKQWDFIARLFDKIAEREVVAQRRAAEAANSQWIGTVGERMVIEATITFVTSYETNFGVTVVTGLKDKAGNVIIQKGVGIGYKGEKVVLRATVKEHGEREGVKQTIICRPTVIG